MNGTDNNMVSNTRSVGSGMFSSIGSCRSFMEREQSLARFNAIYGIRNARKNYKRSKRKLTNQSVTIGKDRISQEGQIMFKSKKREQEERLNDKLVTKLDKAAGEAVKEAKKTQEIIIANGFTLELLLAMGSKDD